MGTPFGPIEIFFVGPIEAYIPNAYLLVTVVFCRKGVYSAPGGISVGADILAGTPSVQQSMSQQPIPYTNPLAAAVGGGLAGLGGLGSFYSQ